MLDETRHARFVRLVLPHLDASYNLARWLLRDAIQAEDAVQEAYLKAFRLFGTFRGEDAGPWILAVIRNCCYTLREKDRRNDSSIPFDDEAHGQEAVASAAVLRFPVDPEAVAIERADREELHRRLRALPPEYREVLVLREIHECSYADISRIVGIPLGTVMSRLSRARRMLQQGGLPVRRKGAVK